MTEASPQPLAGIRVIELGQLLAGPFCGTILGYFGAEIIKVEPPGKGDPIRNWRVMQDGTSLWWRSLARNKKCITLDLKSERGQEIVRDLCLNADVVIENFRPGTMEKWHLGPEQLRADNPGLVYTRISGYGQTGPYASRPGFASVCEGISGFRYINGFPDSAPVRPNLSMGDTLAGIHAALGVVMALLKRERHQGGDVVDVALYESIFNIMEAIVPEFDGAGIIREPSGSTLTGIVPTNTYRCADGKYIVIGGNGDSIFTRLMKAIDQPEMADDTRLSNNEGRVKHEPEIDSVLSQWTASINSADALQILDVARVPSGPIYNIEDMMADPHFNARGMFEQVEINGKPLKIPAITPRFESGAGKTNWPGPELGSHNEEVYKDILGITTEELERMQSDGVV
ncbi:MAG: crotonobetainyl-CoA:carnitine CoA-transferase CaiB-like acyl-CoA transferase [Parasphingorhabdus sp.]|jgi:crotonobetainyl-CoA:carnitine CoA-transferase CaiB-like acyl-CoA transferase